MADERLETSKQDPEKQPQDAAPNSDQDKEEEMSQRLPGYTPQGRTDAASGSDQDASEQLPSFTPQGGDY